MRRLLKVENVVAQAILHTLVTSGELSRGALFNVLKLKVGNGRSHSMAVWQAHKLLLEQ